jgi:3-oxoacyl-[acyl-carrier protein] reductase
VTGSGQSIGRAIAMLMAAEGAVLVTNSRSAMNSDGTPTAADTVKDIESAGGTAVSVFADVGTTDGCRRVVEAALDTYGALDILVNNAGGGAAVKPATEMSDDEWHGAIGTNLTSQFACSRAAIPWMQRAGWGRIVNIGSNVGLFGMAHMAAYAAAKAGCMGLTFALAHELAGTGITVNCVLPTSSTVRNERSRAERERRTGHVVPGSPWRTPEAVAPVVTYVSSDAAGGITGQVIYAAGGQVTRYSWPPPARTILTRGHWTLDDLDDIFPRYFGDDLSAVAAPKPLS